VGLKGQSDGRGEQRVKMSNPGRHPKAPSMDRPERRSLGDDRRKRPTASLVYGSFMGRRRAPRRSLDRNHYVADWHHGILLIPVVAILLLSTADAYLTVHLLERGAREVNWFMARLIHADAGEFVALKMALTGLGLIVLVTRRFALLFNRISVESILYAILVGYLLLIAYELSILFLVYTG
jgi:hypothetical protein